MYRKDKKKVNFLHSVQHKRHKSKPYKSKEKGFFGQLPNQAPQNGGDDDGEFYFPWESSIQQTIDKRSRHIFKNLGDEMMKANQDTGLLNDDFFLDAKPKKSSQDHTQSHNQKSNNNKNRFKPFNTKALRLGENGEFLHFTKALSKQKLHPEKYHIPQHVKQRSMDPNGWRSNCNFIPIEPNKNRINLLKHGMDQLDDKEANNDHPSANDKYASDEESPQEYYSGRYKRKMERPTKRRSNKGAHRNRFDISGNQLRQVVKKRVRRMKVRHV